MATVWSCLRVGTSGPDPLWMSYRSGRWPTRRLAQAKCACGAFSGINPGDTKKRADWLGYGMPFPRVVPHSDGSGVIDA